MTEDEMRALGEKAYTLGFEYEVKYRGCGQCIIAAVQDTLGIKEDAVFKAASGFAGGIGLMQDSACGAYAGGVMVMSGFKGRERDAFDDPDRKRFTAFSMAKKLHDRFIKEWGVVNCRDLHMKMFGRPYYLWDKDEMKKFDQSGGHKDKCPDVVGKAAKWVVEILFEENLI